MRTHIFYSYLAFANLVFLTTSCFFVNKTEGLVHKDNSNLAMMQVSSIKPDHSEGSSVAIPSDLIELVGTLQIQEGAPVAIETTAAALSIGEGVVSAGPSVNVSAHSTVDISQLNRLEISIPYTQSPGVKLKESYLVVLYNVIDAKGKVLIGLIPLSFLSLNNSKITFKMIGFGNYQAALLPLEIKEEIKIETEDTVTLSKEVKETLPALVAAGITPLIAYKGQKISITGQNFRPGVRLAYRGRSLSQVNVINDHLLTAVVDDASQRGKGTIYLSQDGSEARMSLAYAGAENDFPLITLPVSEVCIGQKFYNATGDLLEGTKTCTLPACSSEVNVECVANASFKAVAVTELASKLVLGQTLAGVTGTVAAESHSPCNDATREGCIASSTFRAMNLTAIGSNSATSISASNFFSKISLAGHFEFWDAAGNRHDLPGYSGLLPSNIKQGVVIGTLTGTYPSSGNPLQGAGSTPDLESFSSSLPVGNYEYFKSDGTRMTGTIADGGIVTPTATQQTFSAANTLYRQFIVEGDGDLIADNINNAVNLFGVIGNVTLPSEAAVLSPTSFGVGGTSKTGTLPTCTAPGVEGCVTTSNFKSMNLSLATSGMSDLTQSDFNTTIATAANFEFWDSNGSRHQVTGTSELSIGKIKNGTVIFGVTGQYPSGAYPLPSASTIIADLDNATFPIKIKDATDFEYWNSAGEYQPGAGDADIDSSNISSVISIFGTTGSILPISPPNPWNVRVGAVINGVTGELKVTCRNRANSTIWDTSLPKAVTITTGNPGVITLPGHGFAENATVKIGASTVPGSLVLNSTLYYVRGPTANDFQLATSSGGASLAITTAGTSVTVAPWGDGSVNWWDTIEDYNNNLAFPTTLVTGWTSASDCDADAWEDVTADGLCNNPADDCEMKDRITGLTWSESSPVTGTAATSTSQNWQKAIIHCDTLDFGGDDNWRLPTQKELMEAYIHGIRDLGANGTGTPAIAKNNAQFITDVDLDFWTSSTSSSGGTETNAWKVSASKGSTGLGLKTAALPILCVR